MKRRFCILRFKGFRWITRDLLVDFSPAQIQQMRMLLRDLVLRVDDDFSAQPLIRSLD